jgi:hypothetical protein
MTPTMRRQRRLSPMNRYGRMARDYTRENLPKAFAEIEDPERFFTEAGEEIAAAIGEVHAQILGDRRPGETQEEYQLRSSHSRRTAEELVLADHYLLVAEPEAEDQDVTDDPEQAAYNEALAEFNEAIEAVLKLSE